MLARTADHLYWMSRFIERAEGLARMLDAHYRHSLLPHAPEVVARAPGSVTGPWLAELLGPQPHIRNLPNQTVDS